MKARSLAAAIFVSVALNVFAAELEKINLPHDTSHPEQDAKRAIAKGDFGFIGVYGIAYMIPGVDGVYVCPRFAKNLCSQLKVVRGTSDVHSSDPNDINERARAYATRYNRVLLAWLEKNHRDWLGPREPLTH